jgi:hypothetical protein
MRVMDGTYARAFAAHRPVDFGDPHVTALTLWAFSHGMIQIAASKAGQMEHEGIPVDVFVEHSLALMCAPAGQRG